MVRRGDDEWFAIVKWVVYGLIEAEEYGVTQANVDHDQGQQGPRGHAPAGTGEDTGKLLGLDKDWLVRAVKAVGNYGEIFERNVGPKTPWRCRAAEQPVEQGRPDVRAAGALTCA
jgi:general L-amino acid transport system substrate-binding protein